jgi:hypothetical protein
MRGDGWERIFGVEEINVLDARRSAWATNLYISLASLSERLINGNGIMEFSGHSPVQIFMSFEAEWCTHPMGLGFQYVVLGAWRLA